MHLINVCTNTHLNTENQDQSNYGFSWSPLINSNYSPSNDYKRIYEAFTFKPTQSIYLSYQGMYDTYPNNGFMFTLDSRDTLEYIQRNLSMLKRMEWIDRQTRALIVDFTTFNPNVNLFLFNTILVEFLSSGTVLTSSRFDAINLFSVAFVHYMVVLANIIFMLMMVAFMVNSLKMLLK